MLGSALYSNHIVIYSHALKLPGFVRFITVFFPRIVLQILYIAFIRSRLEYVSVAWNNRIPADSNTLENIRKKIGNICSS
jgi:hypothetical protein